MLELFDTGRLLNNGLYSSAIKLYVNSSLQYFLEIISHMTGGMHSISVTVPVIRIADNEVKKDVLCSISRCHDIFVFPRLLSLTSHESPKDPLRRKLRASNPLLVTPWWPICDHSELWILHHNNWDVVSHLHTSRWSDDDSSNQRECQRQTLKSWRAWSMGYGDHARDSTSCRRKSSRQPYPSIRRWRDRGMFRSDKSARLNPRNDYTCSRHVSATTTPQHSNNATN